MPFLIRSCKSLDNGGDDKSYDKDELIKLLKGLKFKFEITLTDVLFEDDEGDKKPDSNKKRPHFDQQQEIPANNNSATRSQRNEPPISSASSGLNKPVEPEIRLCDTEVRRPRVEPTRPEPIISKPVVTAAAAPQLPPEPKPSPVARKPTVEFSEPPKPAPVDPPKMYTSQDLNKIKIDLEKPIVSNSNPKLAYEIGSEIRACCVSFIDNSVPPTAYISRGVTTAGDLTYKISQLMDQLNAMAPIANVSTNQLVFAKSNEDNQWYRAVVQAKFGETVVVEFIDWGMTEALKLDRLRELKDEDLSLEAIPACAVKVILKFSNDWVNEFGQCESFFKAVVLDYDEKDNAYTIKLVDKLTD